jgi:hypothetical protein
MTLRPMNPLRIGDMAMNIRRLPVLAAILVAAVTFSFIAEASQPEVTQRIEPSKIALGEAARLTIAASGDGVPPITPPRVDGLEFVAVAQSQQVESVNGVTNSTASVTYQVVPRQAGVFTIPGLIPGSSPVVLTVSPGNGGSGNAAAAGSANAGAPQTAPGSPPDGSAHLTADSAAFVRLNLPKHELYVGETIPVDIQVGMRDGIVASLNGPPTLNGDAFTLNKLSSQPERTEEIIDGKPFTVLSWHSVLAAVKPGSLSLTMETPLTVRIRSATRSDNGLLDEMGMEDLFNDPNFQSFFGTSTEKDITVASKPTEFTVLELPVRDRPADFSGAVGNFAIRSDLSDEKAAAGDPVTLRLHVSGTGNFDRVNTRMLHDVDHWKSYAPIATFKPDDDSGDRGEKTFEQPIIAMQPGTQSVPALSFSWFDPNTRRYVVAQTSPLSVAITPASADSSLARAAPPSPRSDAGVAAANGPGANKSSDGLRPDHVDSGRGSSTLTPRYYQPTYIGIPSLLVVAFSGAWLWVRRRAQSAARLARETQGFSRTESLLKLMDEATAANDPELFFKSARAALRNSLASTWQLAPDSITIEDVDAHFGAGNDIGRVFKLADETSYSGATLRAIDFQRWKQVVLHQVNRETVS